MSETTNVDRMNPLKSVWVDVIGLDRAKQFFERDPCLQSGERRSQAVVTTETEACEFVLADRTVQVIGIGIVEDAAIPIG